MCGSKGLVQRRSILERKIKAGGGYSRQYKTQRLFDRPLLFAAETTKALVAPTSTRAFFFCGNLISVAGIMKTLLLLRHAKAENSSPGSSDLNRKLNERGRKEAQAIGKFIKKQNLKFDLVLSSPAERARETTALVLDSAEIPSLVRYDQQIYEASPLRLLEVISKVEEDISAILLVGHNPGMEELVQLLTDRVEQLATATLVKVNLSADQWSKTHEDKALLDWIVRPKELAAG